MKVSRKILLAAIIMGLLAGCTSAPESNPPADLGWEPPDPSYITLPDAAQEWVDVYGAPEDVNEFRMDSYHTADYWWWAQGFAVGFKTISDDGVYGWYTNWTYSYTLIL